MDYWFRLVLAAGFLALPISLFAEEKGLPKDGDHHQGGYKGEQMKAKVKELKQHLTQTAEKNEKLKAAAEQNERQRKEHYLQMKAKVEQHKQELQSKLANWKENHPNDQPPKFSGGQFAGGGSRGSGERSLGESRPKGGGNPGGAVHGGGHR